MGHLTVSLLGSLDIKLDDQPVTHLAKGKARALLAYLLAEADRPHRRETLAGLLWPDWAERSARTNLRNALSNLRTAIGDRDATPPYLLITRETIQFNRASDCWVDIWAFSEWVKESAPTGNRLEQAIILYRGPFLEGFSGGDSPAFDDWAHRVREQLAHLFSIALQALAKQYERRGEHERACEVARQRVAHAPWQEQAHYELMALPGPERPARRCPGPVRGLPSRAAGGTGRRAGGRDQATVRAHPRRGVGAAQARGGRRRDSRLARDTSAPHTSSCPTDRTHATRATFLPPAESLS